MAPILGRKARLEWRFTLVRVDGVRTGGDQAAMSFGRDLGVFVREVLQNSLDARRRDSGRPVTVLFQVRDLQGGEKQAFLSHCGWPALRPHVEGATELVPAFRRGLDRLDDDSRPLRILSVSDQNAVGLGGDEKGTGRFAMFARNKLLSDKQSDDAGGSYGLGKSVLWAFSGISTILVNSLPDGERRSRLIGVSQLPFHEAGGEEYDGPGWFGVPRRDREEWAASARKPDATTLRALALEREPAWGPGTTIVVPDFHDPDELSPRQLAKHISDAAARWFWPAMGGPDPWLVVEVEAEGQWERVDLAGREELVPMLHLADREPQPHLRRTTARKRLPLKLPGVARHMKGRPDFAFHDETEVSDAFEVAVLPVEKPLGNGDLQGKLAMMRGARMVLKYLDLKADQPVYACCRSGTAVGDDEVLHHVEQYLRTAEPPRHDDWTADAPNLRQRYKRGALKPLRTLNKTLREEALKLLRGQALRGRQPPVPAALRKALSAGSGHGAGIHERAGRFDAVVTSCSLEERNGRLGWSFEVSVHDSHTGPWRLEVSCTLAGDSGGEPLPLGHLAIDGVPQTLPSAAFPMPGAGRFAVTGFVPVDHLGAVAREASFHIDFKRAALRRARREAAQ